jgi:hypothetical protein
MTNTNSGGIWNINSDVAPTREIQHFDGVQPTVGAENQDQILSTDSGSESTASKPQIYEFWGEVV